MLNAKLLTSLYSPIIDSMRTLDPWSAPTGPAYLLSGDITPLFPKPTIIQIETDRVGEIIDVEISNQNPTSIGVDERKKPSVFQVVATGASFSFPIQLAKGVNEISINYHSGNPEITYLIVRASSVVMLWESFARVFYDRTLRIIEEQKSAIKSIQATRLLEPYIAFFDLLPDIRSLQIISLRMIARGTIHEVGTEIGARDLTTALALTTPYWRPMERDTFNLYPALDPFANVASQFSGKEAHVWVPNVAIASWQAFILYIANQPDIFDILKVSEEEIIITYQGRQEKHLFDFDSSGTGFLTSMSALECFRSIDINIYMMSVLKILICSASYTFDLFITSETPIGDARFSFDQDVPFDQNLPFDNDDIDPFNDGWVGLSLTGRFEQEGSPEHCLDTFVMPSVLFSGSPCCYIGYFSQVVEHQRYDFDVFTNVAITGSIA